MLILSLLFLSFSSFATEIDLGFQAEHFGYEVFDIANQKILASHQSSQKFIPASTAKVLTAVFALETLGADFTYQTRLSYDGNIKDNVLNGNLYLQGAGDPTLMLEDLQTLALSLKRRGIKRITGKFFYDDSEFNQFREIEERIDDEISFNPGLSALSSHWNNYHIFFQGGEKRMLPSFPFKQPYLSLFTNKKSLPSRKDHYSVKRPSLYTAYLLQKFCQQNGLTFSTPEAAQVPGSVTLIHKIQSLPLWKIVSLNMEYSTNLISELLLLKAAQKEQKKKLQLEEAAQLMTSYFKRKIGTKSELILVNGSGLTSRSQVTPHAIVEFLNYAARKPYGSRYFASYLPISGVKGTLDKRLRDPQNALKLWAKTGSVNYASGLVGYFNTLSGKELAFALYFQDKSAQISPSAWRQKSIQAQDKLLSYWIKTL